VSAADVLDRFTWLKDSSFLYDGDTKVYLDPWGVPDGAPKADVIFVTHAHDDHFSAEDIERVRADHTRIVATADLAKELSGSIEIVSPGDALELAGISVDVVPAYNISPDRQNFHPKASGWVGYVLTLEGTRVYHSGDTDVIPEMEAIDCDIAFLPIGGTYTIPPRKRSTRFASSVRRSSSRCITASWQARPRTWSASRSSLPTSPYAASSRPTRSIRRSSWPGLALRHRASSIEGRGLRLTQELAVPARASRARRRAWRSGSGVRAR
jgi:hypothetical protein